jgi:hypothetical protein
MNNATRLKLLAELRPKNGIEGFAKHRDFVEWQAKIAPLLNFNEFYYKNWINLSGPPSVPGLSSYTYDPLFSQMDNIIVQAITDLEHGLSQAPTTDRAAARIVNADRRGAVGWQKVTAILCLLTIVGISYRLYVASSTRHRLAEVYPRLERLLAIYSVLNWRKAEQVPPIVKESSEASGSEFTLKCDSIEWGKGGFTRPGELFSCFTEPIRKMVPEEGEIDALRFSPNEDYWYTFSWETLFGYEIQITVGANRIRNSDLYRLRDDIERDEIERCRVERQGSANVDSFCRFNTYAIQIDGLFHSQSVSFLAADGYLSWLPNGSVDRHEEWMIYLEDKRPITAGQINKVIQLTARQMQIKETDLSKVAPELEAIWMNKDRAFLDALFTEIDRVPDLSKLSGFLKTGK